MFNPGYSTYLYYYIYLYSCFFDNKPYDEYNTSVNSKYQELYL